VSKADNRTVVFQAAYRYSLLVKHIKVIVAPLAFATVLLLLGFHLGALSAFVMPIYEDLKQHIVDVVVVLVVLTAIIVVSTVPRIRSR
jgi:hypothetical protein